MYYSKTKQTSKHPCLSLLPWISALTVAVFIYLLSAQPNSIQFTSTIFGSYNCLVRKLAHVGEFALLFLIICWARKHTLSKTARLEAGDMLFIGFFVIIFAVSDEWHQSFVTGRFSSLADLGFDTLGILLGIFIRIICSSNYSQQRKGACHRLPALGKFTTILMVEHDAGVSVIPVSSRTA